MEVGGGASCEIRDANAEERRGTFGQSRWFRRQRSIPFEEQRVLNGTAAAGGGKAVSQRLRVSPTTPHLRLLVSTGQFQRHRPLT